jgi:DNA-binding MarR family transcriptional regulator
MADSKSMHDSAPGGVRELADFVIVTNRIMQQLQMAAALTGDLSISDWVLLRALSDHNGSSMADLGRQVGVTRQRIHKQLANLQAAGLVSLARVAPREPSLTKSGLKLVEQAEANLKKILSPNSDAHIHAARMSALRLARQIAPKKTSV